MVAVVNQAAFDALFAATYLEHYFDCIETLPNDLQRIISQLRELDAQTNDALRELEIHRETVQRNEDNNQRDRSQLALQRMLIKTQELGDEKLRLVAQLIELIETRARQLDQDAENLDPMVMHTAKEEEIEQKVAAVPVAKVVKVEDRDDSLKSKRQRKMKQVVEQRDEDVHQEEEDRTRRRKQKIGGGGGGGGGGAAKKEKSVEFDTPVDPNEPRYCLCHQVSYGEMIGCDNDSCPLEWFHFNCVGLTTKPKGKWYCPKCRGDKSNIRRPDLK